MGPAATRPRKSSRSPPACLAPVSLARRLKEPAGRESPIVYRSTPSGTASPGRPVSVSPGIDWGGTSADWSSSSPR